MIFEDPTHHFPPSTESTELKKSTSTSPFDRNLNREMNAMNKALGASENDNKSTGLFDSFKKNFGAPSKMFESASSAGAGLASSFAKKLSEVASTPIKLSL